MLTTTMVTEAKMRVTCTKPPLKGKRFYASKKVAKVVTVEAPLGKTKSVTCYLFEGKKWNEVSVEEHQKAISDESMAEVQRELTERLKARVEAAYKTASK